MSLEKTALSSLMANQAALNVTSNNIANLNTEGYNRQRAVIIGNTPEFMSGHLIGTGVKLGDIFSVTDTIVEAEIRSNATSHGRAEALVNVSKQMDNILGQESASAANGISEYFQALQDINSSPSDPTVRGIAMKKADQMLERFSVLDDKAQSLTSLINEKMTLSVQEANLHLEQIRDINQSIIDQGLIGNIPPELRNQQVLAAKNVSKIIGVNVSRNDQDMMEVRLNTGHILVTGPLSNSTLTTITTEDGTSNYGVGITTNAGNLNLTNTIQSGALGGYLHAREQIIDPMSRDLGRLSLAISNRFNTQNRLGVDLNGELGGDLFTTLNDSNLTSQRSVDHANNTGTQALTVSISDTNALTADAYELSYTGGAYTLTNSTRGTSQVYTLGNTVDGFSIANASGTVAEGDIYYIDPTRGAVNRMGMQTTDGSKIAAASPIKATPNSSNVGTGSITVSSVLSVNSITSGSTLNPNVYIQFSDNNNFTVYNASTNAAIGASQTYTSGADINITNSGGQTIGTVQISGMPVENSRFDITYNSNAPGDNRNGLLLTGLQSQTLMNGSQDTFETNYAGLVGEVAAEVQHAKRQEELTANLLEAAEFELESTSGVNLDEEIANMIQLTDAYQAAARVMQTKNEVWDILLNAMR